MFFQHIKTFSIVIRNLWLLKSLLAKTTYIIFTKHRTCIQQHTPTVVSPVTKQQEGCGFDFGLCMCGIWYVIHICVDSLCVILIHPTVWKQWGPNTRKLTREKQLQSMDEERVQVPKYPLTCRIKMSCLASCLGFVIQSEQRQQSV